VDEAELVARVSELIGFARSEETCPAIRATLSALGEQLPPRERSALGDALPAPFRAGLGVGAARSLDVPGFFDAVSRREGVAPGFGREHAEVVCRVLGELLPGALRAEIERTLPQSVADLFLGPEAGVTPPGYAVVPVAERHDTLATGHPGSQHPLSSSRPDDTQRHSVAGEDNPHADTKLSSAPGLTQERLDESLATAHPETRRRIGQASS
jgi:uncharacterized protein (DUF2267 family)